MVRQPRGVNAFAAQPLEIFFDIENRQLLNRVHGKTGHRQQRNQPSDRAATQVFPRAIGPLDDVVIEAIVLIPVLVAAQHLGLGINHRLGVQRGGQLHEVVEETLGDIGVLRLFPGQGHTHLQQAEAEGRHPGGAITLLNAAAIGQGITAIKDPDVVEAEEAPLKHVVAGAVVAVSPPAVLEDEFAHGAAQKGQIAKALLVAFNLKNPQGRPGADGRIGVRERPFIGRSLGIGGGVPGAAQQHALLLGHRWINAGKGHRVEHQVPLAEVGILPAIGHGDHIIGMHPPPVGVLCFQSLRWR